MKCIKKDSKINRVPDHIAIDMVENKGWVFCNKKEWKKQVRDAVKVEAIKEIEVVAEAVEVVEEKKKKPQGRQRAKKLGEN